MVSQIYVCKPTTRRFNIFSVDSSTVCINYCTVIADSDDSSVCDFTHYIIEPLRLVMDAVVYDFFPQAKSVIVEYPGQTTVMQPRCRMAVSYDCSLALNSSTSEVFRIILLQPLSRVCSLLFLWSKKTSAIMLYYLPSHLCSYLLCLMWRTVTPHGI